MRPLKALAIYILIVFIGGALLAPWLYWLTQSVADTFPRLANAPFHRYVNRALLGLALIGLWPLLKFSGSPSARDLGVVSPSGQWKKLGGAFLLGFLSLALIAGLALIFGARDWNPKITPERLVNRFFSAMLTAVVVSALEELLFRGGLFGALRRVFHWVLALMLSSLFYALVHFMESARTNAPVTWTSGLEILPRMLGNFTDWQHVIPGFFNLTLAGMILALAYQRTGNLYFSFGLHAAWIFWLKFYGTLTIAVKDADVWWWGTGKLTNGWVALPVLTAVLFLVACVRFADNRKPLA